MGKQVYLATPLNALKNDRVWMAETEHLQFKSLWVI